MKKIACGIVFIWAALLITGCVASKKIEIVELKKGDIELIKVNDSRWDGKSVPEGEQGKQCGGSNPHFPSLTVDLKGLRQQFKSKIVGIKMYAYDVDWRGGHHGRWSYEFDSDANIFVSPKVPSETMTMPKGVKGISGHTAGSKFSSGYYLAPSSCVVGGGHKYFTDITFDLENDESITTTFSQGVY
ncbi:MAG: hypothetical protein KAQ72_13950 [Desulfobacula sp.]|nr:hypothetical protein [Desulfobacula sp.]